MTPPRVLLVGWDAADWKVIRPLMAAGKMPHVQRLVAEGASGQIATLHPPLSPMLWTSIATGKRPFKHGIHGFSEPTPDGRGVQPVTNLSRTSKALWNILSQNALRSIVIGWWPSHPAEPINGVMVSDHYHRAQAPLSAPWPLLPNAIHPPELAATLAALRVHPDRLTPEIVEPFVPLAGEIDQDQDQRLGLLLRTIAEAGSVHAAALWLLENQAWDFAAVYFDAIDHFSHGFMKYHPPRQSWIGERDFQLYHNVVSMAYQFHDRMLGILLQRAGPDATVMLLSDHGFHPDHLRPASIPNIPAGPAIEHRDFGILAIRGPGIKVASPLYGASVLDVAPTVLTLFGLPVGEDLDGKVLSAAFLETPDVALVPSWEDIAGADGRHPPHARLDPVGACEALEQMIALGYIQPPDPDVQVAVRETLQELRYNLGEAYQDAGRHREAREIFAELHAAGRQQQRYAVRLFVSAQALGDLPEMRRIAAEMERTPSPLGNYLRARVLTAEKRYAEALALLQNIPGVWLEAAALYGRLGRWSAARRVYAEALAVDPDNAQAHLGLCRVALRRRKLADAAHAALDALQCGHPAPQAHFLLGRALTGMQEYQRAAGAFRTAISCYPNSPEAHMRLAFLLEQHLGDVDSAREHRRLARRMRRRSAPLPSPPPARETQAASAEENVAPPPDPADPPLIVVTGLPRSGTSMIMQMLAAGGIAVWSDGRRAADENNPHGYFEYEPVKNLLNDNRWLFEAKGNAVKIVAPLLAGLPPGLPCRVILCRRDLEAVLDSQQRMLARQGQQSPARPDILLARRDILPARRDILKDEYARLLTRVRAGLATRPGTELLAIDHTQVLTDPLAVAKQLNRFLGGEMDIARMASVVGLPA